MDDLRARLANCVLLSTDGHKAYLEAIEGTFGGDVDYAQLIRIYCGATGSKDHEKKYSPAECAGINKRTVESFPDRAHIATSIVGRQNLTMRMHMRRFGRLTNAFSKKVVNHCYAVALYFMYYNFVKVHQTFKVTPEMEACLTDRLWDVSDIVALVDANEEAPKKRGLNNKRGEEISR